MKCRGNRHSTKIQLRNFEDNKRHNGQSLVEEPPLGLSRFFAGELFRLQKGLPSFYRSMLKVTIDLTTRGNEAAKRQLYSVDITNANGDKTGDFSEYVAKMVGIGIPEDKPFTIKLGKFNRNQGAAKLTSRILSRFYRKYKAFLSTSTQGMPIRPGEPNGPDLLVPPAHENSKNSAAVPASVQSVAQPVPSAAVAVSKT
jgi:hypothetical protein